MRKNYVDVNKTVVRGRQEKKKTQCDLKRYLVTFMTFFQKHLFLPCSHSVFNLLSVLRVCFLPVLEEMAGEIMTVAICFHEVEGFGLEVKVLRIT